MEDTLKLFKAAADPSRLRLLSLCLHGDFSVSELVHIMDQSQPRVSRHLKILCDAGLLNRFRDGNWVYYGLNSTRSDALGISNIIALIPDQDPVFLRDAKRLAEIRQVRKKVADAYFRKNAKTWNEFRKLHIADDEVEKTLLARILNRKTDKVLDVGTGTGRMLEILGPHVGSGEGVDLSYHMLALAEANIQRGKLDNCRVRHGDMHELPYAEGHFDMAVIHQVLHFDDQPDVAINEAARVLCSGGRLAVIDFARHERADMRDRFQHRRLGFEDGEMKNWFVKSGLSAEPPIKFKGNPLTIVIWFGEKSPHIPHMTKSDKSKHGTPRIKGGRR